jgi:hypothetical protein
LPADPIIGSARVELGLCAFECVDSSSNRLPVDAKLLREVGLILALAHAAADLLDSCVGQFGWCSHTF